MSMRPRSYGWMALAIAVIATTTSSAAQFVTPTVSSGTTPSGLLWSAVATGTALPIRTSATNPLNGAAGAVVYVDTFSGQIQFDPKGLNVSTLIITYTTGTTNVSGTSPGPFQYTTGTDTAAWSPATGSPKTFPAIAALTGLPPTTQAARVAAQVGPPLSPSLTSVGDVGNIASTSGTWWNMGWAFPSDLVISGSVSAVAATFNSPGSNYFRTNNLAANANANILGYGSQQSVFQYTVSGVTGNQVGAVIPVVPEPSSLVLMGTSAAVGGLIRWRRRRSGGLIES